MFKFPPTVFSFLATVAVVMSAISDHATAAWTTSEYGDPFQDKPRILAMTQNMDGEALVLKCDGYMEEVYLAFYLDEYIANSKGTNARIRFDKNQIMEISGWADGKTFAVLRSEPISKLVSGLQQSQSVAVEVYSYDYDRIVSSFDLQGFTTAANKVRTTCKFPN